jgi:hypothetical protein
MIPAVVVIVVVVAAAAVSDSILDSVLQNDVAGKLETSNRCGCGWIWLY